MKPTLVFESDKHNLSVKNSENFFAFYQQYFQALLTKISKILLKMHNKVVDPDSFVVHWGQLLDVGQIYQIYKKQP